MVPDSINTAALAELLTAKRPLLPTVQFSDEHPCELSLLIGMLGSRCPKGGRMAMGHMLHAAMCLLTTAATVMAEQCRAGVNGTTSPADAMAVMTIATEMAVLTQARDGLAQVMEFWSEQHEIDFDGDVSDTFLSSIGMSKSDFEEFRSRCRSL
jgi:hypothetical protein